ncbi:hypothetical protein KRR39_02810 [Nocardioides panacis]|uniref:Uncharacterized protein n=1 Tax=Nocardioides panacis TaxID=2849501 RepID=A0A975SZK5_9ACTN|nr:hypothetical protein [Nocardioides panacis]QWZ08801.1 hypothetical protein KRR39_02810 [Nocardioides panacis]
MSAPHAAGPVRRSAADRLWRGYVVALTGVGLVSAVLTWGWGGPTSALLAVGVLAALVRCCLPEVPGRLTARTVADVGLTAGAWTVAVAGLVAVLRLTGLFLLLLAVAGHPAVRRRLRGSPPAPVVTALPAGEPDPAQPDTLPREALSDLEDEALCQAWRRSFRLLETTHGAEERASLAELRGRYLDELDRRHPDGVSRWLASGARAAGNPLPFLADSDGPP